MPTGFPVPNNIRLTSPHSSFIKIPKTRKVQQIAIINSPVIHFKDFSKFYKKYSAKPYSFLVNDKADVCKKLDNELAYMLENDVCC